MGIMVEYKEIWSLSPLHCGVSSYPWTALFQATVQEENTFLSYVKLCYSESSLMLTHLNLLLPLSHILSELKGDFFSFLSDLQRLSFLWNGKPHGSAFSMEVEVSPEEIGELTSKLTSNGLTRIQRNFYFFQWQLQIQQNSKSDVKSWILSFFLVSVPLE